MKTTTLAALCCLLLAGAAGAQPFQRGALKGAGFLQAGTGAQLRSGEDKLRDEVSVKDFGAKGDGTTDDTAAINACITYVESLTTGGTCVFPAGVYSVSSINLSHSTPIFNTQVVHLRGVGRWATRIIPNSTGKIIIDMLGTNNASVEDMTIDSTGFVSQTALLVARSTVSQNANDNRFSGLHILGNYSLASVISIAAESTKWSRSRFENGNQSAGYTSFWSGDNNAIGVSSTNGTIFTSSNTDNVMNEVEFYTATSAGPVNSTVFYNSAAYRFIGCTWIVAGNQVVHPITLKGVTGNIFNGPFEIFGGHIEFFSSAGGVAIFLDSNSANVIFKGLHIWGLLFQSTSGALIDYDRTLVANQPVLGDAEVHGVKQPAGSPASTIYTNGLDSSNIDLYVADSPGIVGVLSFVQQSTIRAPTVLASLVGGTKGYFRSDQLASSAPTSGTYPKGSVFWNTAPTTGTPLGWLTFGPVTLGTLNGGATTGGCTSGANTLTVNSATGLVAGQLITIAGVGSRTVANVSGTTVKLLTNCSATVSGAAVAYDQTLGGIVPFGTVGGVQTLTLSGGSGTATVISGAHCICTDLIAAAAVSCPVVGTVATFTGTGSHVVSYLCF